MYASDCSAIDDELKLKTQHDGCTGQRRLLDLFVHSIPSCNFTRWMTVSLMRLIAFERSSLAAFNAIVNGNLSFRLLNCIYPTLHGIVKWNWSRLAISFSFRRARRNRPKWNLLKTYIDCLRTAHGRTCVLTFPSSLFFMKFYYHISSITILLLDILRNDWIFAILQKILNSKLQKSNRVWKKKRIIKRTVRSVFQPLYNCSSDRFW